MLYGRYAMYLFDSYMLLSYKWNEPALARPINYIVDEKGKNRMMSL